VCVSETFQTSFFEIHPIQSLTLKKITERKATLCTDNSISYSNEDEPQNGEIRVVFLPLIVTKQCQPMNQAVTETPKETS